MDVVGCRRNAFMERLRPIPIGRTVDKLEPIGARPLGEFEWLWVDVYGQIKDGWQDAPELHKLYDGPTPTLWKPCFLRCKTGSCRGP